MDKSRNGNRSKRSSVAERVKEFHLFYNLPVGTSDISDHERMELRLDLITEEYEELMKAMGWAYDSQCCVWKPEFATIVPDPVEVLDALADLEYVIHGMAVELGWDLEEAGRRVHESNMSKLGEDGKPIYRDDGKVLKGPNFFPPDLEDLV